MGVSFATMLCAWCEGKVKRWFPILLGLGGIVTCFFLWINLGALARLVGTLWALAGVLLWVVRRRLTVLPADELA